VLAYFLWVAALAVLLVLGPRRPVEWP